ncbi:MAG: histidinol dehydrogenase [Spirochaetales bacterium]|nr:histidinol dehydrogenase [Spirochaetales bacterium]
MSGGNPLIGARRTRRDGSASTANGPEPFRFRRVSLDEALSAAGGDRSDAEADAFAAAAFREIAEGGSVALAAAVERFGDAAPDAPRGEDGLAIYGPEDFSRALDTLGRPIRAALEAAAARVEAFARAQLAAFVPGSVAVPGGRAGWDWLAVERAGCYVPGGRHPLPSTVLMTAIPARAAGVREVLVASPRPAPATLAACALAGADALIAAGGAHAIAALTLGCGRFAPRDAVVGPGNRWVAAAKRLAAARVRIDSIAGPSELLVLADDAADPRLAALDLAAQAEHDPDARVWLASASERFIEAVEGELGGLLPFLPPDNAAAARAALSGGFACVADSGDAFVALADALAPEHLAIHARDASALRARIRHAGAVFEGGLAAEALADYGAGPNHCLPTGGAARRSGGLSVADFLRQRSWLRIDGRAEAAGLARDAATLARLEGLEAHALAAEGRLEAG